MSPSGRPRGSSWSWWSEDLILSIATKGSVLSIGSVGVAGVGRSVGSIGSAASLLSVRSADSVGSAPSARSRWSLVSWRGRCRVMAFGRRPPRS